MEPAPDRGEGVLVVSADVQPRGLDGDVAEYVLRFLDVGEQDVAVDGFVGLRHQAQRFGSGGGRRRGGGDVLDGLAHLFGTGRGFQHVHGGGGLIAQGAVGDQIGIARQLCQFGLEGGAAWCLAALIGPFAHRFLELLGFATQCCFHGGINCTAGHGPV